MSDSSLARRTDVQIVIKGSKYRIAMNKDWDSFTYTDNEEDEADDFQIKTHDHEAAWLRKYLSTFIEEQSAAGEIVSSPTTTNNSSGGSSGSGSASTSSGGTSNSVYKVTSANGLNVRSSASEKGKLLGKLFYGDYIEVKSISGGWARITYGGKTAYIKGSTLVCAGNSGSSVSGGSSSGSSSSSSWKIGDAVIVNGRPQYTSYGEGNPGATVTNHSGKITHLNLKSGVPYPICVDYLGWFAENQVQKGLGTATAGKSSNSSAKGVQLSASIVLMNANGDGKDQVLDCGLFELDSVDMQGPPSSMTIKGTSLSYASTMRQTLKSKSWENTTLKGIASAIASANGVGVLFESTNNPKYTRVEQYQMSDITFLQKLCHNAGCSLKATNNIIVIFDQADYENKPAVKTIQFGEEGGYSKYKLSTGTNNCYTSCRVYYTTPSGSVISATEYADNYREGSDNQQCLEVRQKVSNVAEAQQLAHKMLRLHNKFEFEATFTMAGDVSLVAGCAVELADFGMWDGKYIIRTAKHTVSPSGYTTQITLRKALEDNVSVAGNSTSSGSDSDAEIDELARQVIRGDWGNGDDRKQRLTAAGHDYSKVQGRVNQILYG